MIEVRNLSKYFGPVMAVHNISFSVDRGEIVGFLGQNGAGKTTTMRILTTYMPATSGIARVAGHDVMTDSTEVRKNIGYLPENVPLYPEMRVEEYIYYRACLKGVERKERQKRVDYCLERCQVKQVRRRLIGTLSKGYRQRVGLADAMVQDPPIMILDEPTTGLDPMQKREALALIKELGQNRTILFSTHILAEVEEVCNRVIIIDRGHLSLSKKMTDLDTEGVVVMEVRGPVDQVTSAIKATDGVVKVSSHALTDGLVSYEIHPQPGKDVREALAQRVGKNGWGLRLLEVRRRQLIDRYMDVINARDPLLAGASGQPSGPASEAVQAPGGVVSGK